jgi:hypothetical protein
MLCFSHLILVKVIKFAPLEHVIIDTQEDDGDDEDQKATFAQWKLAKSQMHQ